MSKFYCTSCNQEFETNNNSKKEFSDPVFGSCWKYVSCCPICGLESEEKKERKAKTKKKFSVPLSPQSFCGGDFRCCRG